MKHLGIALLIVTMTVLAGCSTDSSVNNPITKASLDKTTLETEAAYRYTGYSREGIVVVRGTITLSVSNVGRVAGTWELRGADPGRIGPQVGRGVLTGRLENGVLSINLNPQNTGNNVLLHGRLDRTGYAGRWEWVAFRGVLNAGTFRARRSEASATELAE